jgi:hypothetical protein
MDRLQVASNCMSSARRHLITLHPEGESAAIALALTDVRGALDAIASLPLDLTRVQKWVDVLRAAVTGGDRAEADQRIDPSTFLVAVDELASWLYWREPAAA